MDRREHRESDRDGERKHSHRSSRHHEDQGRHRRRSSRSPRREHKRTRWRDDHDGKDRSSRREERGGHRRYREDRDKDAPEDNEQDDEDDDVGPAPPPTIDPKLEELGVDTLTRDDYFLKAAEFKFWLADSRGKYLDEIPSKDARRYFNKFVARWNEGRLGDDFYLGKIRSAAAPSSSQTRHKWGFASKATYGQAEQDALASVRDSVDTMTNAQSRGAIEARAAERAVCKGRRLRGGDEEDERDIRGSGANAGATDSGWGAKQASASTSYADRQYEREAAQETRQREEAATRRRSNRDAKDLAEEFAPRATGRDAMIEKKRERNAVNREFANRKDDDGFEVDDATLMGGDDFDRALGARSRGEDKKEQRRQEKRTERQAEMNDKVSALRSKEQDTMAMFKKLAEQRFGGGGS